MLWIGEPTNIMNLSFAWITFMFDCLIGHMFLYALLQLLLVLLPLPLPLSTWFDELCSIFWFSFSFYLHIFTRWEWKFVFFVLFWAPQKCITFEHSQQFNFVVHLFLVFVLVFVLVLHVFTSSRWISQNANLFARRRLMVVLILTLMLITYCCVSIATSVFATHKKKNNHTKWNILEHRFSMTIYKTNIYGTIDRSHMQSI